MRTILIAAMLVPGAAAASDFEYNRDVQTRVVNVADLDLSTGAGMDRLIRKLRGTIDGMCGGDSDCRDEAWLSADWQVAREVSRDIWQRRIAEERAADWRHYRRIRHARFADAPPAEPPRIAYAPVPSVPIAKITTTTTTVTKTTTVTLVYRTPPVDYRATWTPR